MKARMKYREQRFEFGDFLEVNIYPVFCARRKNGRVMRGKPTPAAQRRLNQHNREQEVNRVICANFTDEDLYITLTFREAPEGMEQAARAVKYFIAKLNKHRAKLGLPKVKYVKTLEQGSRSGRIHCHLVVSGKGFTAKDIADLWGRGYVDVKPLQLDETGCAGLSRYFVKEKKEGGEKADSCRRSWSCSRNCIRPVPKTNDQKYSKRAVRSIVEDGAVEKVLRARHPDYILGSCEEFHHDENGLYYIYARMYRKDTRLNI